MRNWKGIKSACFDNVGNCIYSNKTNADILTSFAPDKGFFFEEIAGAPLCH